MDNERKGFDGPEIRSRGLKEERTPDQQKFKTMARKLLMKFHSGEPTPEQQAVTRDIIAADDLAQKGSPRDLEMLYKKHLDPNYEISGSTKANTSSYKETKPSGFTSQENYEDPLMEINFRKWKEARESVKKPESHFNTDQGFYVDIEEAARELFTKMHIDITAWGYTSIITYNERNMRSSGGATTIDFDERFVSGGAKNLKKIEFKKTGEKELTLFFYRKNGIVSEYAITKGVFDPNSEIYYDEGKKPKNTEKKTELPPIEFNIHPEAKAALEKWDVIADDFNEQMFLGRDSDCPQISFSVDGRTKKVTFHKSGDSGIGIECENKDGSKKYYFLNKGKWAGEMR